MLEPNKARIFIFILVRYEKIEFSKDVTSSFSKNLCQDTIPFFFKKPALLGRRDKCSAHVDAIPRSISLKLRTKSWNYEDLLLTLNTRITLAKFYIMSSIFYWRLSKVRHIFSKNFTKIECSGKKNFFDRGGALKYETFVFVYSKSEYTLKSVRVSVRPYAR